MAERSHWWTEKRLRSPLFLSLSLSFSDYLPTYLPIYLCTYLSIYRSIYLIYLSLSSIYLRIYLYICLSIYLSFYLSIFLSTYKYIYIISIYLSIYLPTYLSISLPLSLYLSVCLSICLPIYLSIYLSTYLPIYLSTYLPIYLSTIIYLPTYLSIYLQAWKTKLVCETSSVFELDNIKKTQAIQRDFLNFWTWQHQKQSNSARLPQFLHLTTSKTKQFSETSFKNGKLSAELTASYQCVLRFFDSTCLNYCACHEKVIPGHTKCCTCHAKSSQQTWRSDAPNATRRRKSAPGPPNSSDEHVSCTAPATENRKKHLCRSSSNVPRLPSFWGNATKPSRFAHFWQGPQSHAPATRNDIWMSQSGPGMWCFSHFNFNFCFAPQRRALFQHLNFQKWSEPDVFCAFWLRNVLRATTACTFFDIQLPKVVRTWCVLYILTSKCVSRQNRVQFFDIATSKSGPNLVCFVHFDLEMCFAPQWHAIFHLSSGQLAPHPPL